MLTVSVPSRTTTDGILAAVLAKQSVCSLMEPNVGNASHINRLSGYNIGQAICTTYSD